ncbi:pentapeptide repeat-containing protein [Chitinophaga vietnamensis]|uniref:pentapeptide repeat-containing protein n=1 Tax=Chitinophaga vietnamensis TaxID=2593957 RepID=UPI001178ACB7|nr:pentapeptide repeat-containing protein [Chitinophaga vietnamensis]
MDTNLIGNKIAQARKETNMSQAQLAQRLFISPQAVGKWERGESVPDILTINRLAEILGVDLNYFSANFSSVNDKTTAGEDEPAALEDADPSPSAARPPRLHLSAVDLQGSDFAGVILHKGKFKASPLRGANFAGADLRGSTFEVCDAREANFDGADLTDCHFSIMDLTGASFNQSIMVRTTMSLSGQSARFTAVNMEDVKFTKTDLRKAAFEQCSFNGVDFTYCDLRNVCFDGQTFTNTRFDRSSLNNASFRGATLRNVSFIPPFSVTNRSHLAMKTISFDGAMMDKLTYAALKGLRVVDLSNVTII